MEEKFIKEESEEQDNKRVFEIGSNLTFVLFVTIICATIIICKMI